MKILLIEDDQKVSSFIKSGLEQAHHTVDAASTYADADFMSSVNNYDLLVLDCMLPDGDGRNLCRELRNRGEMTPILLLTAKTAIADKVLGLDSGADDYLTKPFAFSEFLARVRALARRPSTPMQPSLEVADLALDPATRRAMRSGNPVELTSNEYKVLELLVRKAGKVVTRTEILEQVWSSTFDTRSNIVDVVIKMIRDKVDRSYERKLIHTIRGVGYTIKTEFES
jgi:DNA-binding response OmpR family regulator